MSTFSKKSWKSGGKSWKRARFWTNMSIRIGLYLMRQICQFWTYSSRILKLSKKYRAKMFWLSSHFWKCKQQLYYFCLHFVYKCDRRLHVDKRKHLQAAYYTAKEYLLSLYQCIFQACLWPFDLKPYQKLLNLDDLYNNNSEDFL